MSSGSGREARGVGGFFWASGRCWGCGVVWEVLGGADAGSFVCCCDGVGCYFFIQVIVLFQMIKITAKHYLGIGNLV